jgi:hypothetical protein
MNHRRKQAELQFMSGVNQALSHAREGQQYDGLLITVLADLIQIQCLAAGRTDLLVFRLPFSIGAMVEKVARHQGVHDFIWAQAEDGLAILVFDNEDVQDKFIQIFEMLSFTGQRAYPTADIYLGQREPDVQLCSDLLKLLNQLADSVSTTHKSASRKRSVQKVWMGAIYLDAEIKDFGAMPRFVELSQALRCYLVEYDNGAWSWKLFWSKPGQHGATGTFNTRAMKEDPPLNGERYFNDANPDKTEYSVTLTLTSMDLYGAPAFMYRQQFDGWCGAFMGNLVPADPRTITAEWMDIFEKNAPK